MILLLLFLFLLSIIVKHTIYSQVHVFCISPVNLCRCSLFGWLLVVVAFSPFDYCIVIDHKSTNIYSKCTLMTSCASTPHIQSLACWQTPFSLSILFRRHFCYEIECSVLRVYMVRIEFENGKQIHLSAVRYSLYHHLILILCLSICKHFFFPL